MGSGYSTYWKKIRNRVKEVRRLKVLDRVFVISGPLFLKENGKCNLGFLEPGHVPIPTHFFQLIFGGYLGVDLLPIEKKGYEAYIVPNKKIDIDVPLDQFKVTLEEVKKKSQIKQMEWIWEDEF